MDNTIDDIFTEDSSENESETYNSESRESRESSESDNESITKIEDDIELLEHQTIAIEYLVAKCTEQKGLLVNHYQGTGKMITGIFFLKNYPKYKKTILCPKALITQWQYNSEKLNLDNNYISFEDIKEIYEDGDELNKLIENLKNNIVIIDEAHNLIEILQDKYNEIDYVILDEHAKKRTAKFMKDNLENQKKFIKFIEMFYKCKKILLLTGTPIINDTSDIRWLINIAAGKKSSTIYTKVAVS